MSIRRAASVILAAGLCAALAAPVAAQPANAYFEFLMARRLEAQGDAAGALAALERAAAADPASAEVKAEIASFHLRRDRRDEAERAARQALALDDNNLEAHRVLGLIYAAMVDGINVRTQSAQVEANAREAVRHLERAISDGAANTDSTLYFTLGRLYLRTGSPAKAIDVLTRVVNNNPGSVQGRLSLAQAHAAANDVTKAIATLDSIVDEEPRVASSLAQYQERAGLLKQAAQNYTRALALQPMSRELKFRRVAVLFRAKEYTQAAAFAAEAQGQHPEDLRFPRLRARAVFETGAAAQALLILEPTAKAYPRDAATQFAMADLYNDAGRDVDAERTLRQLLDIQPGNAEALNYLGYLLADKGRELDEALRLVQRALETDPDNPAYLDSLGWAHYRRGDLDEAEKYIAPAAERLPRNATIQDHLGDVLARRGRWQDAIAAWTRALDGDDGGIDRAAVEKKISDAQAKMGR